MKSLHNLTWEKHPSQEFPSEHLLITSDPFREQQAYKDPLAYLPDCFKANQTLKRVIEGIIQIPLKTLTGTGRQPPL